MVNIDNKTVITVIIIAGIDNKFSVKLKIITLNITIDNTIRNLTDIIRYLRLQVITLCYVLYRLLYHK
jgi:hypothetical protein